GHGSKDSFLGAVFQDMLGRNIDTSGATTLGLLLARGAPRAEVVTMILHSPEANQVLVSGLYQRFLRRPVDPTGLSTFVPALQNGIREEDVLAAVISSDEYLDR